MDYKGFYLLSATINGVKCIDNDIELSFYKKTIDKSFDPELYRVKGIFGENGSGKTAIINAFSILRSLLLFPNYIQTHNDYLSKIMNKKRDSISIECVFLTSLKDRFTVNKYYIEIRKTETDYRIVEESLYERLASSPYSVFKPVFRISNGTIEYYTYPDDQLVLKDITRNILLYSSLSSLIMNNSDLAQYEPMVILLYIFALSMVISLPQEDRHEIYAFKNTIRSHIEKYRMNQFEDSVLSIIADLPDGAALVNKRVYKSYFNRVKKMEKFIKIFKSELNAIDVVKKVDGDNYRCYLIFNYGNYKVDYEFESAGIKKLVSIFDALYSAAIGMIVFIDEIDANINSIYLEALIEYMMAYGKGQLCFTSHNIDIMDSLKQSKKAIDFLTNDRIIVPWVNAGNKSPSSSYKNGLIEGMPYNIYSTDFLSVFGADT